MMLGYQVETAPEGKETLEKYQKSMEAGTPLLQSYWI